MNTNILDCFFCPIKLVFVFRNDKRFFIKTQSRHEIRFLLSSLQRYVAHLEKYPHSLMVRFLGKQMRLLKKLKPNKNVFLEGDHVTIWTRSVQ